HIGHDIYTLDIPVTFIGHNELVSRWRLILLILSTCCRNSARRHPLRQTDLSFHKGGLSPRWSLTTAWNPRETQRSSSQHLSKPVQSPCTPCRAARIHHACSRFFRR